MGAANPLSRADRHGRGSASRDHHPPLVSNARLSRRTGPGREETALGVALDEQGQCQAQDQAWEANIQAAGRQFSPRGQRFKDSEPAEAMELKPGHAMLDVERAVGCLVLPDLEWSRISVVYRTTVATFSRDLTKYARIDTQGKVVIHRVEDDRPMFEIPIRGRHDGYHAWSFSPDGRYFWHHEVDKWRVWDVGGERAVEVLELTAGRQAGIDFTADSTRLALVDWEAANKPTTFRLFNLREPDPARRKKPVHEAVLSTDTAKAVWAHPTRPDVLLLTGDSRMTVYDVSQPERRSSWLIPESVSWSRGIQTATSSRSVATRRLVALRLFGGNGRHLSTLEGTRTMSIVVWFDAAGTACGASIGMARSACGTGRLGGRSSRRRPLDLSRQWSRRTGRSRG